MPPMSFQRNETEQNNSMGVHKARFVFECRIFILVSFCMYSFSDVLKLKKNGKKSHFLSLDFIIFMMIHVVVTI